MSKSYERLYYYLRPAKSIERKMLCEALRRLLIFSDLTEYRYVGFGSTFFSDFMLIHKSLGINDLISIEKEEEDRRRFIFNRPYKCIKLRFGEANDVLPTIRWTKKIILWLDYDYSLRESMLTDIGTFISRAQTGSVILLTMDVTPDNLPEKKGEKNRYEQLTERISKAKIPIDVKEKDLDPKNYPRVCHEIVNNEIDEILAKRNGGLENKFKLIYKQLFNFIYKDGSSPMLSIGGILYSDKDKPKIDGCNFNRLNFIRCNKDIYEPYKIDVPILTFREMRYLDKILPYENISGIKNKERLTFLKTKMVEDYSKIYRYFPNFVEAEMH
jgi:hypothetical protein